MKWLFIPAAAAFGLAAATPAAAAPDTGAASAHDTQRIERAARDHAHGGDHRSGTHTFHERSGVRHERRGPTSFDRSRHDWDRYQPGHRPPDWAQRHGNFDRHSWQRNFRAHRRYRWRPYRRPHGWYYRRWEFGMILPLIFWTRDDCILDYWEFGLPDPPYGFVWVRYGDDALLVNVRSGYILQVVYGLFD